MASVIVQLGELFVAQAIAGAAASLIYFASASANAKSNITTITPTSLTTATNTSSLDQSGSAEASLYCQAGALRIVTSETAWRLPVLLIACFLATWLLFSYHYVFQDDIHAIELQDGEAENDVDASETRHKGAHDTKSTALMRGCLPLIKSKVVTAMKKSYASACAEMTELRNLNADLVKELAAFMESEKQSKQAILDYVQKEQQAHILELETAGNDRRELQSAPITMENDLAEAKERCADLKLQLNDVFDCNLETSEAYEAQVEGLEKECVDVRTAHAVSRKALLAWKWTAIWLRVLCSGKNSDDDVGGSENSEVGKKQSILDSAFDNDLEGEANGHSSIKIRTRGTGGNKRAQKAAKRARKREAQPGPGAGAVEANNEGLV